MSGGNQHHILIEKYLKAVPLFKHVSPTYLQKLQKDYKVRQISKGEDIILQTDESTDLFIILGGKVRVSFMDTEGRELVLTIFKEGDFFGEMSLIDGEPRSASIIAEEDTLLGIIKREDFIREIKLEPMIAVQMLTALVKRLRDADDMIESLAFLDVRERLLKFFVSSADRACIEKKNDFCKIQKLTHRELASRIGASREAISKVMKDLNYRQMIIEKENHLMLNPDAFRIVNSAVN